ncbi:hypothetical protein ABES25_16765 [Bacillus gobiensis]|uniref:hypothetical protein n=1 Tax=Bacillus gobiensis TaxID=1441095 RepID=UPI003D23218C
MNIKEAFKLAENIQNQMNEIVKVGDSSVEAAQARENIRGNLFSTLKDRIDSLDNDFEKRGVDVAWFGAKGDGVTDDYRSIAQAVNFVKDKGYRRLILSGSHRIGRGNGREGGITISDISDLEIVFMLGAEILMDNLNSDTQMGDQAHGILIKGNSTNIKLVDPKIRWKTKALSRSLGDGIHVIGNIDETICARNIDIIRPKIENTPQTGMIFQGCKDVNVENVYLSNTWADGVHFNACHSGCRIKNVIGRNIGDDVVAFVTYYNIDNPQEPSAYENGKPPWNSPDITTRNNNGTWVENIYAIGGNANGVRISGGFDITVNNVTCINKKSAVNISSSIKGGPINWTYLASRKIKIQNINSINNQIAIQVESQNITDWETNDPFGMFDILVMNINSEGESQFAILIESARGVKIRQVKCDQEIRFRNHSDVSLKEVDSIDSLNILGKESSYGYPLRTTMPEHSIEIMDVTAKSFQFQFLKGLRIRNLKSKSSSKRAFVFNEVVDMKGNINSVYPNRDGATATPDNRALFFTKVFDMDIDFELTNDDTPIVSFEIGGGVDSEIAGNNIKVKGVYRSQKASEGLDHVLQGGPYAATNIEFDIIYRAEGGEDPKWLVYNSLPITALISPPTVGTYRKGSIIYNSNPVPGGFLGWVCVAAGTPGIWRGFGLIEN